MVTSTVIPMGWTNVMPLVLYLLRRLLLGKSQRSLSLSLPVQREIRKDRIIPQHGLRRDLSQLWQVYCDGFDAISCGKPGGPAHSAANAYDGGAMQLYALSGVPVATHKRGVA